MRALVRHLRIHKARVRFTKKATGLNSAAEWRGFGGLYPPYIFRPMCCTSMIAVLIGLDRKCLTLKHNICVGERCPARGLSLQDTKREALLWPENLLKSLVLG